VERRLWHRVGYAAGSLVVVAGAVIALRNVDTSTTQKPVPPQPVQTTVKEFADDGVLAPQPGARPATPANVVVVAGPHRLQVSWAGNAAGYDVQLNGNGGVRRTKLVVDTAIQFDGLDDDVEYQVQVRAVDSYGQRSEPATKTSRPNQKRPDESHYTLVDHFDGAQVPDLARWQLANNAACASMARGGGDDSRRLVISAACSSESMALRSRTPLRLKDNGGELGRMMIESDAPGDGGELTLDLVPGPVDLVETTPRGALPPGTFRVRITQKSVQIQGANPIAINPSSVGISVRWELLLRTDGLQVWRNGALVGTENVLPTWSEATPLFGFTGAANGLNFVAIDAIGLSSADTPAYLPSPMITAINGPGLDRPAEPPISHLGGQLRMTIRTNYGVTMPEPFTVTIYDQTYAIRPAVAGQRYEPGLRYPVVADLPAGALTAPGERGLLGIRVRSADPQLAPEVQHAEIELLPDPAHLAAVAMTKPEPLPRPHPVLAVPTGALLDATGQKIESGLPSPQGRVVLDVGLAGVGELAALAGVEVRVDGKRIAGIPTNRDGPGVAGHWRLALNTSSVTPGVHELELRAVSTDGVSSPQVTYLAWQVPD
jgi:hypothetical protein